MLRSTFLLDKDQPATIMLRLLNPQKLQKDFAMSVTTFASITFTC